MYRYSGFALSIHSEVELPDLPPGDDKPDVTIRIGPVTRMAQLASMEEEVVFHTLAGIFHLRQGREIIVDPLPGVDPALLQILLAGRMMAFLLRQRGWLALHASGVEIEGQAILFLGASGSGKSTTAAAFHARGHRVITDDVGVVHVDNEKHCLVRPGGSRIRLLDDSREIFGGAEPKRTFQWDKHLFNLAGGELRVPFRVKRIYLLAYGEKPRCDKLPALETVAALSRNSVIKHARMDREALAAHLRGCAAVATAVPVLRLVRLRSLGGLPELVRLIENDQTLRR